MNFYWALLLCPLHGPKTACYSITLSKEPVHSLAECQLIGEESAAKYLDGVKGWRLGAVRCSPGAPIPDQASA